MMPRVLRAIPIGIALVVLQPALAQENTQGEGSFVESTVASDQATLTVRASPSSLTPVEAITLTITLDVKPGWYPAKQVEGLAIDDSWDGLHVRDIQHLPPALAPDNISMRHVWSARVEPFLPGEESIRMLGVRLFPESSAQSEATILRAEPLAITVISLLDGADDFVPAALPLPMDINPEPSTIPAWTWFIAGILAAAGAAALVLLLRRRENPAMVRLRQQQSLRAQLALLNDEHAAVEHLRQAHRLLLALERFLPNPSLLPNQLRDDLASWHADYERQAFHPEPSSQTLITLIHDSVSIGNRIHEFASTHKEAS